MLSNTTYFECQKNGVRLGAQAHCGRSLLHGLQCILDLVQTSLRGEDGVIGVVSVPELYVGVSAMSEDTIVMHTMTAVGER